MVAPIPIQRSRARGHKHPPGTLYVNRKGRQNPGRSSLDFGNPWHVTRLRGNSRAWRVWRNWPNGDSQAVYFADHDEAAKYAVAKYDEYLADIERREPARYAAMMERVLAAPFVACFCPVREPDDCCHRSVLMRRAGEFERGKIGL